MAPHCTFGYCNRPGKFSITYQNTYSYQVNHCKDSTRFTQKKDGKTSDLRPQIHIYGCSFTYGWSLPDSASYPWLVQDKRSDCNVINFAVGGYGTLHALLQLKQNLSKNKRPAMAVYAYASVHDERNVFLHQFQNAIAAYGNLTPSLQYPYVQSFKDSSLILGYAALGNQLPWWFKNTVIGFRIWSALSMWIHDVAWSRKVTRLLFLEMQRICQKQGIPFLVMGLSGDRETAAMLEFCSKQGVSTLNTCVDLSDPKFNLLPIDAHPNEKANEIFAAHLLQYLEVHLNQKAPLDGEGLSGQ